MSVTANSRLPSSDLSIREKIAQLIFVRIGSNLPPVRRVEEDEERALRLLEDCPVGGLLLFNGGPETKAALERLQTASKVPLLVASDIERGVGQQVKGYTLFPHAMAFEKQRTHVDWFVDIVAREARDVGIHITFGPVADVNTNPLNPIISIRAFSASPQTAAQLTAPYVAVAEDRGLLSTAKHFPGHGDTHQDSHDTLPTVSRTLEELRECELLPFQAAIDAGCSLVMTAHVAFPNIDPCGAAATLSSVLLQDLLRAEMGFNGVVCSDSLLMAGVRERFASEGEMALAVLKAGVDLLLDIREPAEVMDYLLARVDDNTLSLTRIDEAFARFWNMKQKVFGRPPAEIPWPRWIPETMPISDFAESLPSTIARSALEVAGDGSALLPFDRGKPLTAILLKSFETAIDPPEQPLAAALRERFENVKYVQLGPTTEAIMYQSARELARNAEQLLLAMIVRPAAWHAFGLLPEQREFVQSLTQERSVVLASLGVPYALQDYPDAAVRICTYSDVPVSQQALAEFVVS